MSSLANNVARINGVRIPWKGKMLSLQNTSHVVLRLFFTDCFIYSYLVFRIYQHLRFFTSLKNRGEFTNRFLSHCQVKQSYLFLHTIYWIRSGISLVFLNFSKILRWKLITVNILNLLSHTWNVGSHSIKFKASSVSFPAAYT